MGPVNKSKAKGTAAETAVVKWLRLNGFPDASRRPLAGRYDVGDILLVSGLIAEVKAHATVTDGLLRQWLMDTYREMDNAHCDVALLIVKRPRKAVGDWWAWQITRGMQPSCYWLADTVHELRYAGWGDSLVNIEEDPEEEEDE